MSRTESRRMSGQTFSRQERKSLQGKKEKQRKRFSEGTSAKSNNVTHNKKQKVESSEHQKYILLANKIKDYDFQVNELFQLREYKSLVYWNPADFSRSITSRLPSLYEDFIKNNNFNLSWDDQNIDEQFDNAPLRIQRKILAEREKVIQEKYPFKDSVIEKGSEIERHMINLVTDSQQSNLQIPRGNSKIQKNNTVNGKVTQDTNSQRDSLVTSAGGESNGLIKHEAHDNQEREYGSQTFKSVKYSIPPHIITHPSHIASSTPEELAKGPQDAIPDYHPQPLSVVATRDEVFTIPNVQLKLQEFLNEKYKTAIIDESITTDYNYTSDEFNRVTESQKNLMAKLYEHIWSKKTLELNGDKIENRKFTLSQHTNKRSDIDPFRELGLVNSKMPGLISNSTHHDYFLAQGMALSKIHQQLRKQHQLRARKVAQMVEQHFKKKNSEQERSAREKEQNLKRISRMAAQAVRKRWLQACKVHRYLQMEKQEELKKIKGREHLSQMLEHSTNLLEAQLKVPLSLRSEGSQSVDASDTSERNSVNSDDSDRFSESETSNEERANDDDRELGIEELRRKYAYLDETAEKPSGAFEEGEESASSGDSDATEPNAGLSSLYNANDLPDISKDAFPYLTEDKKNIVDSMTTDEHDSLLDSDGESATSSEDSVSGSDVSASTDEVSENIEHSSSASSENHEDSMCSDFEKDGSSESTKSINGKQTGVRGEPVAGEKEQSASEEGNSEIADEGAVTSNEKENGEVKIDEVNGHKVRDVETPYLLKGDLRPYQKQGLNWLASLYNNNTNGILADEMGLGKTIQAIALLAYLASEHHVWGPHLIVVPTSVMLNWEMEFKKFGPGFKVLTYYGSPQQRAQKRKGWNKPDAFHICITSYQLVVHDHQSFKRRKWRYMILDEAHNIKNFRSSRWKALLNFNTENRLLLTGTPLQNNLIELWSLLYFLMPSSKMNHAMPDGFANLDDFQQWFGKPVDKILEKTSGDSTDVVDDSQSATKRMDDETKVTVSRLHQVLRPYILRRLKKDVETQMPGKYEHVIYCKLSKRQSFLYDEFMSRAQTKETLASGNYLSIINCLMQLRKVCNHPDLFEIRAIVTSFAMKNCVASAFHDIYNIIRKLSSSDSSNSQISLNSLSLDIVNLDRLNHFVSEEVNRLASTEVLYEQIGMLDSLIESGQRYLQANSNNYIDYHRYLQVDSQRELRDRLASVLNFNKLRCERKPLFGESFIKSMQNVTMMKENLSDIYDEIVLSLSRRASYMAGYIEAYSVVTPSVVALDMKDELIPISTRRKIMSEVANNRIENPFHQSQVKLSIAFPDKSLLQYDCGKLQKLAVLLPELISNGHRALIFTQMTKVLDILEQFLNIHGYRYLRLDGATKIEDRQLLTQKFNTDPKIPVFILSTRSGGLGINLAGADTVIFYDSDWNPAMDKQCQDRCHRIGQMRDVHIYRFVSEYTMESNILKKANQKRQLDNVVIQEGDFTTDYFGKFSVKDLLTEGGSSVPDRPIEETGGNIEEMLAQAEDESDRVAANAAMQEVAIDQDEFDEKAKNESAQTPISTNTPSVPSKDSGNLDDMDYEEVCHIDEYMLRFIANGYFGE